MRNERAKLHVYGQDSRDVMQIFSRAWTAPILKLLMPGRPIRFGQLHAAMPHISTKMLVVRIREMEASGYLTRTVYPEIPPRVEYTLTAKGKLLVPIIEAMEAAEAAIKGLAA